MSDKPRVRVPAGSRPSASYLRDTRSGVIGARPAYLREGRDEIRAVWDRTAALAMDLIHNAGQIKGAVDQIIADTVGTELHLNPQPMLDGLGYNDAERRDLVTLIKQRWKAYAWNPMECDARGRLTVPQNADIGIRYWLAFGESTAVMDYFGPQTRRKYGIQTGTKMLMVPPSRLDRTSMESIRLLDGIRHDENWRPVAYRFKTSATSGLVTEVPAFDIDGRRRVLHVYDPACGTETRGISPIASAIRRYLQRDVLFDATTQITLLQTIFAIVLTSDSPSAQAFEAMEALRDSGSDETKDVANAVVGYLAASLERASESKINVNGEPTVSHLAPGEKLSLESVKTPNSEFRSFLAALDRDMARALGITYGGLTMNYEAATYSSVRMETSALWPLVMRRRERIAAPHYQCPYELWLDEEIGTGRIPIKGGYEAFRSNREQVCWALWQGPAKPSADDGKSAKAASERIANGTTTLAQEIADLGMDPDEVFQQRLLEHNRYVEAGMPSPFTRSMPSDPASGPADSAGATGQTGGGSP